LRGHVARIDQPAPMSLSEQHPVVGDRGHHECRREHRPGQHHEVAVTLERVELWKAVGERHGEQEGGQDLDPGLRDTQFLQQLVPVAVERLASDLVVVLSHATHVPRDLRSHARVGYDEAVPGPPAPTQPDRSLVTVVLAGTAKPCWLPCADRCGSSLGRLRE